MGRMKRYYSEHPDEKLNAGIFGFFFGFFFFGLGNPIRITMGPNCISAFSRPQSTVGTVQGWR